LYIYFLPFKENKAHGKEFEDQLGDYVELDDLVNFDF